MWTWDQMRARLPKGDPDAELARVASGAMTKLLCAKAERFLTPDIYAADCGRPGSSFAQAIVLARKDAARARRSDDPAVTYVGRRSNDSLSAEAVWQRVVRADLGL